MSVIEERAIIGDSAGAETVCPKAEASTVCRKAEVEQSVKLAEFSPEVQALRKLQLETKDIQSDFFKRIYELEIEFQQKHEIVYKKRCAIVNGTPDALTIIEDATDEAKTSGIPRFWSNVLSSTLFEIQKSDRPILEHLTDVRARSKPFPEIGFILEFDFSPNEYFENETLTKEYFYTCSLGNEMVHQGPQIYKSVGSEIKWKDGKSVSSDSFFNFFRSKTETEQTSGSDETYGMNNDFEMGHFIKERVIPRAVLFYNEKFNFDAPLPSAADSSCYSVELLSPVTSSMFPNAGSCDQNESATAVCGDSTANIGSE